ncbi:MAG: hypothetical protein AAGB22_12325, partial [Bacteroidota bacterium]
MGMATAQEGPGGAGSATTNRYWYDVNQIDQLDNTSVSSWVNRGGNGTAAIQNALNARPFYREGGGLAINGMPVLEMDGFDDRMVIPNDNDLNTGASQTVRTFFVVVRTGADVSSRQVIYEEGGSIRGLNIYINSGSLFWGAWNTPSDGVGSPWPFQFISTPISASTTYIIGYTMAGNDAITGTITGYLDGVEVGTMSGIGRLYAHSGAIGIGAKEGATVFETGSSNGNGERFSGEVAEFIHYNTVVTQAERILVENYLSSKYNIAIGANDRHSMDSNGNGNYDYDVAGIGQAADASSSTDGQGSSIVRVSGANNLGNNEFLLWGHNG